MPKVTEEYKQKKRKMIVQTAWEILEQKPLYELNMLDVIKKAGLSKGGIYLYFSDIDELLTETINTIFSSYEELVFSTDVQNEEIEAGLISIFRQLGDYIEKSPAIIGKIRSELLVYIANHPEKTETLLPNIKLQQTGAIFNTMVSEFLQRGIRQNLFRQDLDIDIIMTNIMIYVDGITEYVTRMKASNVPQLNHPVSTYFEQFIRSQINQLRI